MLAARFGVGAITNTQKPALASPTPYRRWNLPLSQYSL
jgi:hypothetical protein